MTDKKCLFCGIVAGRIPADIVAANQRHVAFRDIDPQAPAHVLIVPREHVASLDDADPRSGADLGEMLLLAAEVAREEGIAAGGYRVVISTGRDGGQEIPHLHVHVLGGRSLGWPPG